MDIRPLLVDVVRNEVPELDDALPLRMIPGLDSLAMVNLVLKIEGALGRELSEHELERLTTVSDLRDLMRPR